MNVNKNDTFDIKPFYNRRNEINIQDGILTWGYRVVVPTTLRRAMLTELHKAHFGIVETKSLARSYIWWPGIDKDIEVMVKSCTQCSRFVTQQLTYHKPLLTIFGPKKGYQFLQLIDCSAGLTC